MISTKLCQKIALFGLLSLMAGCVSVVPQKNSDDIEQASQKNSENSLIAPAILRVDIDFLVANIIAIHPEPFSIISEKSFRQNAEIIKRSIRYPLSRSEFYLRLAPLVASLGDIHSQVELPKHLQNIYRIKNGHTSPSEKRPENNLSKLFPLAVLYEEQAFYVAADLSANPSIPTGAAITTINGAPIEFLLQVMKRLVVKETETGQRRRIQVDFPWLLAVMGYASENYQIEYLWNNQHYSREISGITPYSEKAADSGKEPVVDKNDEKKEPSKMAKYDSNQLAKPQPSFYGFSQLNSQTALLWFNDFKEDPQVFKNYINQKFKQLKSRGVGNLIIDVRYNDGGLSQNIKTLIAHLIEKDVFWSQNGEIAISNPLKTLHQQKTKQRRINKYRWGLQWLPLEWTDALQYEISWGDIGEKIEVQFAAIEPADSQSHRNIIILTNGFCYSACSSFVAAANYYSFAATMGETAGSFAQVQYAYPLQLKMPHSQLELTLPTMKLMFSSEQSDRKTIMRQKSSLIEPKFVIHRTQAQISARQDALLNAALTKLNSSASNQAH